MKNGLLTLLLVIITSGLYCQTDTATTKINGAEITFEKDFYEFGPLKCGEDFNYTFEFTNTGNEPLLLENVGWGMGYMMFIWPKEPILPGKKGTIRFSYDTKRIGKSNKSMTVLSNAKTRTKVIQFTLEVLAPIVDTTLFKPKAGPRN